RRTWLIARPKRDLEPAPAPRELLRRSSTRRTAIAESTDIVQSPMSKSYSPHPSHRPRERQLFESSQNTQHLHLSTFAQVLSTSCRTSAHRIADFKHQGTLGGDGGGQSLAEDDSLVEGAGVGWESGLGPFLGWSENWALVALTPCV
ncbi:hypothetical protein QBC45DRAFT_317950, partial [Copromyces sp. CBS 386.78]